MKRFIVSTIGAFLFINLSSARAQLPDEAAKEATAERDRLGSATTLRTQILSTKGSRIYPAFAVYQASTRTLFFAERLVSGNCPAKNLWAAVLPLKKDDAKAAPKLVENIDCVYGLELRKDKLHLSFEVAGRRGFTEVGAKLVLGSDPLDRASKWFPDWRWKKDIWEDDPQKPFSLKEMNVLSSELDETKGTMRLYGQVRTQAPIRRLDVTFDGKDAEKLPGVVDFSMPVTLTEETKAAADDTTPNLVVDPANQVVYRLLNGVGPDRMARLAVWKMATPDKPQILGTSFPYIYRRVWDEMKSGRWAARKLDFSALTPRGIVVVDTTSESNEWPVAAYYSPHIPDGDKGFVRIRGVLGSDVGGVTYFSGGLIVSLSDKQEVVFILGKGLKNPFPEEVYPSTAPDEIEKGRDDK